jgi:hypothetical protein
MGRLESAYGPGGRDGLGEEVVCDGSGAWGVGNGAFKVHER